MTRTMTVASQRMFRILERWNNNQVTPSLNKPHELSYRSSYRFRVKLIEGNVGANTWIGQTQTIEILK